MGENMLGRLNLGGAGAGLNKPMGADLSASTQGLQTLKSQEGGIGTYRSNLGVDKSMDNFKLGFGQRFGNALGSGLGSNVSGQQPQGTQNNLTLGGGGAVIGAQPQNNLTLGLSGLTGANKGGDQKLENSMRKSNLLSTPSSKAGNALEDEDQ